MLAYCDIEDYDTAFKTLYFMAKNECDFSIKINTKGIVETEGEYYIVKGVSLEISDHKISINESLVPHFVVILEEAI